MLYKNLNIKYFEHTPITDMWRLTVNIRYEHWHHGQDSMEVMSGFVDISRVDFTKIMSGKNFWDKVENVLPYAYGGNGLRYTLEFELWACFDPNVSINDDNIVLTMPLDYDYDELNSIKNYQLGY